MWVMGASATMLAHAEGRVTDEASSPDADYDHETVSRFLDALVQLNVIKVWELDADGDYTMLAGNETSWFSPDRVGAFISGAAVVLQAQARDSEREED